MGWTLKIHSHKEFKEEEIVAAIQGLPRNFKGPIVEKSRQPWGWSGAVDIYNPVGTELKLHGAYYSYAIANEYAWALVEQLKVFGHRLKVGKLN